MTDKDDSATPQPDECGTEGCDRTPDFELRLAIWRGDLEYDTRWACEPCLRCLKEGSAIPGGNVGVVQRV